MKLNIVIPVYDEGTQLLPWLQSLAKYLAVNDQVMIVDASDDSHSVNIADLVSTLVADNKQIHYLKSDKGRATQMNAGADFLVPFSNKKEDNITQPSLLWFLHSDSGLSIDHFNYLHQVDSATVWGRFNIKLVPELELGPDVFPLGIISKFMNLRSRLTQVMTGDQGIFIRSDIFQQLKGYADISLMEDIEISKRLRKIAKANCTGPVLQTSARRWQQQGWAKTVLLMWQLRLMYWFGASPETLVKKYYG
jgi:rSAM/selenodomain-associated transferase 2